MWWACCIKLVTNLILVAFRQNFIKICCNLTKMLEKKLKGHCIDDWLIDCFCDWLTAKQSIVDTAFVIVFRAPVQVSPAFQLYVDVVAAKCGTPAIEPSVSLTRIVGGVEARKHSWPWQCLLLFFFPDMEGDRMCGGTVISDRYILTAAHCL